MSRPKVFFDASVVFSAIYSKTGGSRRLAELSKNGEITAITTESVIDEVEANREKFTAADISTGEFIKKYNFYVREKVTVNEIKPYLEDIAEKDAHIIAGAINTKSDCIVTFDKKHINREEVRKTFSSVKICSPKSLLEEFRSEKMI